MREQVVRFRSINSKWLRVGLSSIALHLAVVSLFSAFSSPKPTELVYLSTVYINQPREHNVSRTAPARAELSTSGSTQSAEGFQRTQNSFTKLSESLYLLLNSKLTSRAKSLEMLIGLEFSQTGELKSSEVVRSSGWLEVDKEVIQILKTESIFQSPELANLKVQIPLRVK